MADIVKMDYLLKKSMMKKWYTTEKYQNRWIVLKYDALIYYDGTLDSGYNKEKGAVPLVAIKVVAAVDDDAFAMPNAFQVVFDEFGELLTLYIVCNYSNQRDAWVEAVSAAALNANAKFWNKYHSGAWRPKMGQFSCCHNLSKVAPGCKESQSAPPSTPPPKFTTTVVQLPSRRERNPSKRPKDKTADQMASRGGDTTSRNSLPAAANTFSDPYPPRRSYIPEPEPVPATKKMVVALYDYIKVESGDIDLRQGKEYELVEDADEHWWKLKSPSGELGLAPRNYVQQISEDGLEKYGWYYKNITRVQAEAILRVDQTDGCFLVRDSTQPGKYTLSVYTQESDKIQHYHIQKDNDEYFFTKKYRFSTVIQLITHHKAHPSGLVTKLSRPPSERKMSMKGDEHFLRQGKWKIDAKDLTTHNVLGRGEFSVVHKGTLKNGAAKLEVAVKVIKPDKMSEEEILREASLMTQMKHDNLVMLYGICFTSETIKIVTEFMKHGALQKYVERHQGILKNEISQLLDMCVQVASGMSYLENKKFIHRDLAARNCLVGVDSVVKVCDFGLARFLMDDEYVSSGTKFPVRWAAPEVLEQAKFSIKSDVWSFGVLMWEIFSFGALPYGKEWNNGTVFDRVVNRDYRLKKPNICPPHVYSVMLSCWTERANDRPDFFDLHTTLEALDERI